MSDDMRGLFFIVKGQYVKGLEPSFVNDISGDTSYIGGYDPYDPNTREWYMLMDCKTFHCISCGSSLKKMLKGVYNTIKTHKGVAKRYFKHVSEITSEDYYEVTYLGHTPLTREEVVSKAEGRCPRVSPIMKCLYRKIYEEFGDYYEDEIKEMEDLAYADLVEEKPINKTRKLVSKNNVKKNLVKAPTKEEKVIDTTTPKKLVKPKVKMGVKKLTKV